MSKPEHSGGGHCSMGECHDICHHILYQHLSPDCDEDGGLGLPFRTNASRTAPLGPSFRKNYSRKCVTEMFSVLTIFLKNAINFQRKMDIFCKSERERDFQRIIFTAKTIHFQGCLRVWSRGHQVRRHPCKLGNLAIFYNAKNFPKIYFF